MLLALHRLWTRIEDVCAIVAAVLIGLAMVLTVAEVIGRRLFNAPIPGVIDMFDLGMAAIAFLGASQCQRVGGHVRMELVIRRLSGRVLWAIESVTVGVALVFVAVVTIASFEGVIFSFDTGDSTMDLLLPVWPSKTLVTIALGVLTGRLLLQCADSVRLTINPKAEPVAALPVASVIDHAKEEIEEALGDESADSIQSDESKTP